MWNRKKMVLALAVIFILNIMIIYSIQSVQAARREKGAEKRSAEAAHGRMITRTCDLDSIILA